MIRSRAALRGSPVARLARLGVVALLLAGSLAAGRLALPSSVVGCSCMMPEPLVAYADDAGLVIVAGSVTRLDAQGGLFRVDQVFKGPIPRQELRIEGGDEAMCGVRLRADQPHVMVASLDGDTLLPSSCLPYMSLAEPGGQALLAEATEAYGNGAGPPVAPVEPTGQPTDPPSAGGPVVARDLALPIVLGGTLAAVVAVFSLVALVARRRRTTE